ncbi:unnamed protein product [Paramecium sonneborni]|uniref:Uncharacterized protein n=1 Tax=Paramecium sonneborni TaxID=65129 RepID=A0A8S1RWF0_9CILI|nr:unnamed protein product [Paramecium sonneborni]
MAFKKMLSNTSINLKNYGTSYPNLFNQYMIRLKWKTHQILISQTLTQQNFPILILKNLYQQLKENHQLIGRI